MPIISAVDWILIDDLNPINTEQILQNAYEAFNDKFVPTEAKLLLESSLIDAYCVYKRQRNPPDFKTVLSFCDTKWTKGGTKRKIKPVVNHILSNWYVKPKSQSQSQPQNQSQNQSQNIDPDNNAEVITWFFL